MTMDDLDKKIIRAMQDEFPLVAEPYKEIANTIGITEDELLARLQGYKENGQIRKMGAVLRHREVGYKSNVLCAWEVPSERLETVALKMSEDPAVSHCYDRNTQPDWPYNVYTMIHGHSREECEDIAQRLAVQNDLTNKAMLFSVKEWKKTSMRYFTEQNQ
jgi:DNA-binding Lrp family transcriptional regulator